MTLLITEIMEKLKQQDEVLLLELLNINSEMIIDRFSDLIEERMNYIERTVIDYD